MYQHLIVELFQFLESSFVGDKKLFKIVFANSTEIISFAHQFSTKEVCPGGGIGRRAGFKIQFWQRSAGSIPAPGTFGSSDIQVIIKNYE